MHWKRKQKVDNDATVHLIRTNQFGSKLTRSFILEKMGKLLVKYENYEVILCDKLREPRLDPEGNLITAIRLPSEEMVSRVFLKKPDERDNMKRARVTELIGKFDNEFNRNPTCCKFKIPVKCNFDGEENNFKDIMLYNKILDYFEKECNNEDGDRWKFRNVLRHSLIVGKNGEEDVQELQMLWETGAVSTKSFEFLAKEIPVELAVYA